MSTKFDYDPDIIVQYGRELYARAHRLAVRAALGGLLLGMLPGLLAMPIIKPWIGIVAAGALVGALIGYQAGQTRAFWLKLRAQTTLCQVMIEMNTRKTASLLQLAAQENRATLT